MKNGILLKLVLFVATSLGAALLLNTPTHAEAEYRWNNPETIVVKSDFFKDDSLSEDHPFYGYNTIELTLDRHERWKGDLYVFKSGGFSKKFTVGHGLPGSGDLVCVLSGITFMVDVSKHPAEVKKYKVDVSGYRSGGVIGLRGLGSIGDDWGGRCSDSLEGGDAQVGDQSWRLADLGITSGGSINQKVNGIPGEDAARASFDQQVNKQYDREALRYMDRSCGTDLDRKLQPSNFAEDVDRGNFSSIDEVIAFKAIQDNKINKKNCRTIAQDVYDTIWGYCRREALDVIDADSRIKTFTQCIKTTAGLDIDDSELNKTTFHIINYEDGNSCTIRYIGWIICPTIRFAAKIVDSALGWVVDEKTGGVKGVSGATDKLGDGIAIFFEMTPLNRGERAGDTLFVAWSIFANLANIVLVFVFFAVMLSQVSSIGISNYGIKRLLPKLIVTAILINISYYLCAVLVDISNIVGHSMADVMRLLSPDNPQNHLSSWTEEIETILTTAAVATGATYVAITSSLAALVPLIIGALLSYVIAVIVILVRYGIILSLIAVAPLAIACSLLPNTQQWYKRWQSTFISMLVLYPLISIIFGGSIVAATLILNSGIQRDFGTVPVHLLALGIQALPLALTPLLMKLAGGILGRVGVLASQRGFFAKTKERAQGFADRKKDARDLKGLQAPASGIKSFTPSGLKNRAVRRRYLRQGTRDMRKRQLDHQKDTYIADTAMNSDRFANRLAKGGSSIDQVRSDMSGSHFKVVAEEAEAAKVYLQGQGTDAHLAIARDASQSEAIRQAAIELVLEDGNIANIDAVVQASHSMTSSQRQTLVQGLGSGRIQQDAPYYKDPATLRQIRSSEGVSTATFNQHVVAPAAQKVSDKELHHADPTARAKIERARQGRRPSTP